MDDFGGASEIMEFCICAIYNTSVLSLIDLIFLFFFALEDNCVNFASC